MTRRKFIQSAALAAVGAAPVLPGVASSEDASPLKLKGNIHHSVCRWCYSKIKLDDLCVAARDMGLVAIDLLNPPEFATVRKYGLACSMVSFPTIDGLGGITKAFNRLEHHDRLVQAYEQRLRETADAGFARLICFSGNRDGQDDETGLANCATGLQRLLPLAEKLSVTLCMELLNSKRNHKDYQCDHVAWGAEVCRRVNSPRVRLLFDIYHVQVMDGDICRNIQDNFQWIAHFHAGGIPGRHEIDGTQELNYRFIAKTIADLGFTGYVAHEWTPAPGRDAMQSLAEAVDIMDA